jgi:hypothetical protein
MEGGTTFHFIDASPAEALKKDYEVEATSSPSGVTHVTFTRAGA